jgi:DNA-binding response OmpR family regulator
MKLLLMEDDPVLGEIITDFLEQYYMVERVFDSAEAQSLIDEKQYDLFIFDINVPGISGVELLEDLRSFNNTTPAIVISAYEDLAHLKRSFAAGAHDYIRKPFELEELKLRIEKSKVLFHIEQDEMIILDETCRYYPHKRLIVCCDEERMLKPKEAEILDYFIAHPHRVISQEELIQNLWRYDTMPSDATLRSYIRNLRKIIGTEKIKTQRRAGYRYE